MLGEAGNAIEGMLNLVNEVCPEPRCFAIVAVRSHQKLFMGCR
jgi:hypothetical protein